MAFPLVVNPRSAAVEVVDGQFSQSLHIDVNVTRNARFILFPRPRSVTVEVVGVTVPAQAVPTQGQFIPPIVEPF